MLARHKALDSYRIVNPPSGLFVYGPDSLTHSTANQANYWTAQYTCLTNYSQYGDTVMNQYDKYFHHYIPLNYGWAYDDVLGISSAVTIDATKSGFTMEVHNFHK
jgi:hypothetical protein